MTDINRVLEHYGSKTRDRRSYMTNCILHEDRTPSLSVQTEKGVWNCKSCGQGGGTLQLIMAKEEVDIERAGQLAATLGVSAGGTGGGHVRVRGGRHAGGGTVARRSGDRPGNSSYVPRWRRQ